MAILVPVSVFAWLDLPPRLLTTIVFPADEILLANDKTVAVIDGSGVLADPHGINRAELIRLAKLRIPVSNFNLEKLSKEGYLVKIEDQDVKLPCALHLLEIF